MLRHANNTKQTTGELAGGRLDAAILALPIDDPGLREVELFSEEFVLVRPETDRAKPMPGADALRAAVIMFAFGLGTSPALILAATLSRRAGGLLRNPAWRRAGGALLIVAGLAYPFIDTLMGGHGGHGGHADHADHAAHDAAAPAPHAHH